MLALLQAAPAIDQLSSVSNQIIDYLKLLAVLAGVLILAFVVVRHWLPSLTGLKPPDGGPIEVMARFPLEPRKTLYIIRTGSDYFLIGTSETDMFYLTSVDAGSVEQQLKERAVSRPPRDFRAILGSFTGKRGGPQ